MAAVAAASDENQDIQMTADDDIVKRQRLSYGSDQIYSNVSVHKLMEIIVIILYWTIFQCFIID